MKAAVLDAAGGAFHLEDLSLEGPRQGEVTVRILACGVCRSDQHLATGATPHPMPVVCGHEGSGVVEEIGPGVTNLRMDDRVILSWAPACGTCFYCRRDLPAQCETWSGPLWKGTMLDGTTRLKKKDGSVVYHYTSLACFAEAAVVDASCCVPITTDIDPAAAALIGCAVTTGAGAALFRAQVEPESSVVVFGCGGVGVNIIQGAVIAGASLVVGIDPVADRRAMARRLGATHLIDPTSDDPVQAVRDLTQGRGADYSFEAIGLPRVMEQAIEASRPGGCVVLVGLGGPDDEVRLGAGTFTRSDRTLMSAYYGGANPARDMPRLLQFHEEGKLQLDPLIGRGRPLAEVAEAMVDLDSGEVMRGILLPGEG